MACLKKRMMKMALKALNLAMKGERKTSKIFGMSYRILKNYTI